MSSLYKNARTTVKKTPARSRRTESVEQGLSRFEFARRHVIARNKLEKIADEARGELFDWRYTNEYDILDSEQAPRKPKNPDERAAYNGLLAAVIDAEARVLLHNNDGREL